MPAIGIIEDTTVITGVIITIIIMVIDTITITIETTTG
jgi:hypothetical protein